MMLMAPVLETVSYRIHQKAQKTQHVQYFQKEGNSHTNMLVLLVRTQIYSDDSSDTFPTCIRTARRTVATNAAKRNPARLVSIIIQW